MQRLSYISHPRKTPYQIVSLVDLFQENAEKFPKKEIAIFRKPEYIRSSLTYSNLMKISMTIATYLVRNGTKIGDHIGILGPNSLEWIVAEMGILICGAVAVHLCFDINVPEHIKDFLTNANCKTLILDVGDNNQRRCAVESVLSLYDTSALNDKRSKESPSIIFMRPYYTTQKLPDFPCFQSIIDTTDIDSSILPEINPFAIALTVPTAGSTGQAKWMKHSHCSLINANNSLDSCRLLKFYCDRPFAWLSGCPTVKICTGNSVVFTDASLASKTENTRKILSFVKEENCTDALFAPSFLKDILQIKEEVFESNWRLNLIATAGSSIRSSDTRLIGTICNHILVVYAISELGAVSGKLLSKRQEFERGNCGVTYPGIEIKCLSPDGDVVDRENIGRLFCRRNYMFQGYFNRDDLTSSALTTDGWFDAGDLGIITDKGELVIKGRVQETIDRGSRKIPPFMIEEVILRIPQIQEVAVIAVPDNRLKEEVCVCYVADNNDAISPAELETYCRSHFFIDDFEDGFGDMPKYFLQFSEFPILPVDTKLDLQQIKRQANERLGLATEED